MDTAIIKKMNEIIGILKVIEREIATKSITEDKQRLIAERKPAIDAKLEELERMMSSILTDAQTINYHRQLKDEVARVFDVNACPKKRYIY